ncbi:MAG: amino acid ABC transporter substrate-binding protein [Cyanobacteria bacterium J06600_6]
MFERVSSTPKFLLAIFVGSLTLFGATQAPKNSVPNASIAHAANESTASSGTSRLDIIKERGFLLCGINGELPGFSYVNAEGRYQGIDVDLCRAIAAALFDDPTKVKFRSLNAQERFDVLKAGEVDLLSRNTTQTLSRDTNGNLEFTPPIFYDAQGVMVHKDSEIEALSQLENKTICVPEQTTSYDNLQDYLRQEEISAKVFAIADRDRLFSNYEQNRCQAITGDTSQLIARRTVLANPKEHLILPQTISQEPLAPALIHQDSQWFDVVKWITFTLIQAEELDITSKNVSTYKKSKELAIRRFLGLEGSLGTDMGLSNDFARRIIKHVGNYSEIYERNLGEPFGLERGRNALWNEGGLMYSPPFN